MYKSKDDENISRTMQDKKMEQKKSGIYMDRMDGALPQNRVSKYYQDTNPKMEQEYTGDDSAKDGNMLSRALSKLEGLLPGPTGQGD
jgi:hypothetical protein